MLRRITSSYFYSFLKYQIGLRSPISSLTQKEKELLSRLSAGKNLIVEVGVDEGSTSRIFCQAMACSGTLYLIDPYEKSTRIEKLLRFSFAKKIARDTIEPWKEKVQFIPLPSAKASLKLEHLNDIDLLFIDARHDYDSVKEDFADWSPKVAATGMIAFHDSLPCDARRDLDSQTGAVRFAEELMKGMHGCWEFVVSADSLSVFAQRDYCSGLV